ncbi:hypothetical protein ACRALDRAFT_2016199 [Sodiomyces alcalophilus JCM 7366]|uniref:uncharacterized protein n=1 Tax=Sodiomyces alcalophilus JCM 7366 TaxID=591952 RepID=UPI0039B36821
MMGDRPGTRFPVSPAAAAPVVVVVVVIAVAVIDGSVRLKQVVSHRLAQGRFGTGYSGPEN